MGGVKIEEQYRFGYLGNADRKLLHQREIQVCGDVWLRDGDVKGVKGRSNRVQ